MDKQEQSIGLDLDKLEALYATPTTAAPAPAPAAQAEPQESPFTNQRWSKEAEMMESWVAVAQATATPQAPAEPTSDEMRQNVRDAVADALAGLYYCGRVWSAWSVGTMSEDDFSPAEEDDDIIENVVDAAINAMVLTAASQDAPAEFNKSIGEQK